MAKEPALPLTSKEIIRGLTQEAAVRGESAAERRMRMNGGVIQRRSRDFQAQQQQQGSRGRGGIVAGETRTGLDRVQALAADNPALANALAIFSADLRPGTRTRNSQFLDNVKLATSGPIPSGPVLPDIILDQNAGKINQGTSKGLSGGGVAQQISQQRTQGASERRLMEEEKKRREEEERLRREREQFDRGLRQEELKDRLALLMSAFNRRGRDELTGTNQQIVNIAGRPELRTVKNTQEIDRTADILRLLGG